MWRRERATVVLLCAPSSCLFWLGGAGFFVRFKGAQSAVPPGCGELGWRAGVGTRVRVPSAPELVGEIHHGAEQCGAVVVQQFDEAGFLDEAAEFDKLSCSCPAFLDPIAGGSCRVPGWWQVEEWLVLLTSF